MASEENVITFKD